MKQSRIQPGPSAFLVLLLIATLLVACDEEQVVPPPPETVNASGIVWEMPLQTPLAGATVQLITNEFTLTDPNYVRPCDCQGDLCLARTTSNAEGLWAMEVPVKYDEKWAPFNMLIKVSKGTGPPQYNLFQPGGTNQGDLQILSPGFFLLFALDALVGGADLRDLSVMFGVAIGFIDPAYPQKFAMMPGVKVTALGGDPAEQFPITYLGEEVFPPPDPPLTETSSLGVFYFTVPDANEGAAPSIKVSGDKPGSVFVSSYFPACPGSSGSAAVIDPYFKP